MERPDYLFFPLRNEQGFKVDSPSNYQHMINTIVETQVQLVQEYPHNCVLVVYEI